MGEVDDFGHEVSPHDHLFKKRIEESERHGQKSRVRKERTAGWTVRQCPINGVVDDVNDNGAEHVHREADARDQQTNSDVAEGPAKTEVSEAAATSRQNVAEQEQGGDFLEKARHPPHSGRLRQGSRALDQ